MHFPPGMEREGIGVRDGTGVVGCSNGLVFVGAAGAGAAEGAAEGAALEEAAWLAGGEGVAAGA